MLSTSTCIKSSNTTINVFFIFSTCTVHGLTSRIFFVAHFKLDASIKFPGDQSISHNHDHPRNGEQHKQKQNVPKEDTFEKQRFQF